MKWLARGVKGKVAGAPLQRPQARLDSRAHLERNFVVVTGMVGLSVYAAYHPYGSSAAGALTIAAGIFELTPLRRNCRRRCRETMSM
jgi:hypothetical protein